MKKPSQRQILNAFNRAYEKQLRKAERVSYRQAYKVYKEAFKQASQQYANNVDPRNISLVDTIAYRNLFIDIYKKQGTRFAKWWRELFVKVATKADNPEYDLWQMAFAQYGETRAGEMVTTVQESMKRQFESQLRKEMQDPEFMDMGNEERAQRLLKSGYWNKSTRWMAERVARTETGIAASLGQQRSSLSMFKEQEMEKRWITARDEKVRPDHVAMDGKQQDFDKNWILPDGTEMIRPRITAGGMNAPQQVINCRCAQVDIPKPQVLDNLFDELMNEDAQPNRSQLGVFGQLLQALGRKPKKPTVQIDSQTFITSDLIDGLGN